MPATVVDNRKRAATPPQNNKIVASPGLPKNDAPAGLGTKGTTPAGARPPAVKGPSRILLKQLEESAPYPDTFEAQCYWVLARHDLGEAKAWAVGAAEGDESVVRAFEKHLNEYRASGRPVGFLSEASTAPDDEEGSDAEAAAAHADPKPARVPTLNEIVEAWFRDGLDAALALGASIDVDKMYAKAKELNPALYAKCVERDKALASGAGDTARRAREDGATEFNVVDAAAGKPAFKKRWSSAKREKAQKMLHEGASIEVVAEAVDMPAESVQAYALELSQMAGTASPRGVPSVPGPGEAGAPQDSVPAASVNEVYQTEVRVEVKLDPLAAPSAEVLSSVLQVKHELRWDTGPAGAQLGARSADELVTYFEERLHAARWLKQNGVR